MGKDKVKEFKEWLGSLDDKQPVEWMILHGYENHEGAALLGWEARQEEIDELKNRNSILTNAIKWYLESCDCEKASPEFLRGHFERALGKALKATKKSSKPAAKAKKKSGR